ncbi:hypothetical protein DM02DRAFT_96181 [Periconia macrospinosa]|uniref:Uncharacterized protein n=1 Tax=Periconia macrospinosa TaxID=97972 RepID=A0A2V1DFW9_9PLEO|nr:hypothetical protein DM02DRAFT_96181 [Periconia macrospinosa]
MAPSTRSTKAAALPQTPTAATAAAPAKATRSRKGQAQSQQQPAAAAPNNKKRRLRSAKPDNASPLQLGVPTTTRRKATPKTKALKATKQTAEQDDTESVASAGTGDGDAESDADPGAAIFFKQNRKLEADLKELREARRPEVQYLVREFRPEGVIEGSESAIQLLHHVEKRARKPVASTAQPVVSESSKGKEAAVQTDEPAQLSAPLPSAVTPQSQSFFGRVKSFLASPFRSSLSSQSSQSPQASSLTETLTPSPTPVGESHSRHRKSKKISNRSRIIQKVVDSVSEDEKVKAKQWAESLLQNVTEDGSLKRKRREIELGVTVGSLQHLQGTKPWKEGTFGLDDDIADLEDDEHAPAWAVLHNQMQLDEDEQQPPTKKRKSIHDALRKEDLTPLRSSASDGLSPLPRITGHFPSSSPSGSPLFNSGGKTASRNDVQPRRAIEPSPMFDADMNHRNGTNVFNELQGSSVAPQTSTQKRAAVQEASPRDTSLKEADFSNACHFNPMDARASSRPRPIPCIASSSAR